MPADFVFFYEMHLFCEQIQWEAGCLQEFCKFKNVSLADSMVSLRLPYNHFILYWGVLKIRLS